VLLCWSLLTASGVCSLQCLLPFVELLFCVGLLLPFVGSPPVLLLFCFSLRSYVIVYLLLQCCVFGINVRGLVRGTKDPNLRLEWSVDCRWNVG